MPRTDELPLRVPPTPRSRGSRPLETVLLASTACLLAAVAWPIVAGGFDRGSGPDAALVASAALEPSEGPVIQVALLLDTSSSMGGLIDQARSQLWNVVNTLDGVSYQGGQPRLEIAVYEYGNDSLSGLSGWVRQVTPFSSELDTVSEALFSLTTKGGAEFAGHAIRSSINELDWRSGEGVLKVVYVAGNEGFAQGPVPYRAAIEDAKTAGVVVNTIFCGRADDSDAAIWREATVLSGGRFATIDHNYVAPHIVAPQDEAIAGLGQRINDTYVRYGADGRRGLDNLVAQDNNMAGDGAGGAVSRSVSKSSGMYRNDSWDLVDAISGDKIGYGEVDRDSLPEGLQGLDDEQLREHVQAQQTRRNELQEEVAELAAARELFLASERTRLTTGDPQSLDYAIVGAIRAQAVAAGFTLDPA